MKLMTVKQLMKKSKTALIRKITKSIRSMPKKKLCMLCYEMSKSKLPRLKTTKQKRLTMQEIQKERKRYERKMSPRLKPKKLTKAEKKRRQKKLNALINWRVDQGMKRIVVR